jgi:alpha-beta hydrolase superfamily lysophospholipase
LARLSHPGLPAAIVQDSVQHSWVSFSETMSGVILASGAPAWLDDVHCPVALFIGDHDPVADRELLAELATAGATVSSEVWAGAGHDVPFTLPAMCTAAILDMVARTDPWLVPSPTQEPQAR